MSSASGAVHGGPVSKQASCGFVLAELERLGVGAKTERLAAESKAQISAQIERLQTRKTTLGC